MQPINGILQLILEWGTFPFYRITIKFLLLPYEQTSFY
jgi:hypothetical protein